MPDDSRDGDRDLLRAHRRLMRDMRVAEHELQRVLARRQRQLGFRLPRRNGEVVVAGTGRLSGGSVVTSTSR